MRVAAALTAGAVLADLRSRTEAMVDLLSELASIETPSTERASQAAAFDLLERELDRLGYHTRRLPGHSSGGMLYGLPDALAHGRPRQLLLGHVDTVWPLGTHRRMPVRRQSGRLYGPGVYDMKGEASAAGGVAEPPFLV